MRVVLLGLCQSKVFHLLKIFCYHAYHARFKTSFPKHPKLTTGRAMFEIIHVTPKHVLFAITQSMYLYTSRGISADLYIRDVFLSPSSVTV